MPSITVKHEVRDQFLADVLTTAVESGGHALWYWEGFSMINIEREVKVDANCDRDHHTHLDDLSVYKVEFSCDHNTQTDGEPDTQGHYVVELSDIAQGIQWILDGTVPVAQRLVSMIASAVADDDADIDAEGADVIVQACAFGELVFG